MKIEIEPPYLVMKPGFTEEDFYRLAGEDSDWEYLDGNIVMHSPASYRHEDLFTFLVALLRNFVGERGGALVLGSRYPMRLDESWSPEPDIMVVRSERRDLVTKSRLEGPADMVIEIVSQSDSTLIYRAKLPRYREAGIPEVWIIDPFRREVLVELRGAAPGRVLSSGRLHSAVLPGFGIDVAWLWQETLGSPMAYAREILGPSESR